MKIILSCLILAQAASVPLSAEEQPTQRVWTDDAGKYRVEAAFESFSGDRVVLKRAGGTSVTLPLSRLCAADQALIRELAGDADGLAKDAPVAAAGTTAEDVRATAKGELSEYNYSSSKTGKVRKHMLNIEVTLTGGVAAQAYALGKVSLEPIAVGSESPALVASQSPSTDLHPIDRNSESMFKKHPKDGIRLAFRFSDVPQGIQSAGPIKGSVTVMAGGEEKTLELDVAKLKNNARIKDSKLTDAGITGKIIRSEESGKETLGVELKSAKHGVFQGLHILDAKGEVMSGFEGWASFDNTHQKMISNLDPDELKGARLVIRFNPDAKEIKIPFHVAEAALQ